MVAAAAFLFFLAGGRCGEIHDAAAAGDLDLVRRLVEANPAAVNERDREGKTPLHYAAANGHLAVVEWLVAHKAEINARSTSGITPTYLARGLGKKEVAAFLLNRGGSTEIIKPPAPKPAQSTALPPPKPAEPVFPIIEAAKSNMVEQVKALLAGDGALAKFKDGNGWTALHYAAERGFVQVAKALLDAGADVNVRGKNDSTPLHLACRRGQKAMAELLILNGADVNATNDLGATPLILAAAAPGSLELVKLLVERKAQINARDRFGANALLVAAMSREQPDGTAELLVKAGSDINVQDSQGFAPLHGAILNSNRPLFELLLANKANVNLKTSQGFTPLAIAKFERNREFAALLEKAGGKLPEEKPLTPQQKLLVEQYRQYHATLAEGQFDKIKKLFEEMAPTKAEVERVFGRNSEAAWALQEKLRREEIRAWAYAGKSTEDRRAFLDMIRDGAEPDEYLIIEPEPPSPLVAVAKARNLIARDVPVSGLKVWRRGEATSVGDFYLADKRWVLMPPLSRVFPELFPQ